MQIRTDADGNPNSSATDFRWSVTQIGAQGDPGADITVAVPEEGLLLHNLQKFGMIPQEDGKGLFDISLNDTGFGTARSVSLVPPEDFELPVELTTEFTLDGEPILAQDLVGKDGVVTAKYTVINRTRETLTVPITSVTGEEIEKEVEADVPMVVEAVTLLPDRFSALNMGAGLGGADGRGNTQVKWIALPFSPLSEDGTSSFGWAANVTNAVIPSMLVQVLPIYIPPGEEGEKEAVSEEARQAAFESVPPPDVSGDVNAIKDGVADVISGLETLTADDGSPDPRRPWRGTSTTSSPSSAPTSRRSPPSWIRTTPTAPLPLSASCRRPSTMRWPQSHRSRNPASLSRSTKPRMRSPLRTLRCSSS